jgi:hypothetical protein
MPSTSLKQKNFMAAVANNPTFAKKAGVPQSVGADFATADKGIQFKGGPRERPDLQRVNKAETLHGKSELFKKGGNTMATKGVNPFAKFEASSKDKAMDKKEMSTKKPEPSAKDKSTYLAAIKKGMGMKKMAKGGGIESKGKTKGKMISMAGNQGLKKGGSARSC